MSIWPKDVVPNVSESHSSERNSFEADLNCNHNEVDTNRAQQPFSASNTSPLSLIFCPHYDAKCSSANVHQNYFQKNFDTYIMINTTRKLIKIMAMFYQLRLLLNYYKLNNVLLCLSCSQVHIFAYYQVVTDSNLSSEVWTKNIFSS